MEYRLPTLEDKDILMNYVEEHYANYQRDISASNGLTAMDFEEWVNKINRNSESADDDWGKYYLYLVFNDNNRLVGLLNIRYDLTEELREAYGNIGYGVRPSERGKGYATQILNYALGVCKGKNMSSVVLGCYENNDGSSKTILNNNGVMYKTDFENIKISDSLEIKLRRCYYKIEL